jgi:hypothetical protein
VWRSAADAARDIYGSDPNVRTAGVFGRPGMRRLWMVAIASPVSGRLRVVASIQLDCGWLPDPGW